MHNSKYSIILLSENNCKINSDSFLFGKIKNLLSVILPTLINSIEIYKNTILPLQEEIRNLTYDHIEIEKQESKSQRGSLKIMPKYIIHKTKESIENHMTYDEFKIIKNKK